MQFQPSDTAQFPANVSTRAMFMYLRAAVSMYQLPVAVASPLLSLQKVLGKNTVRDVGLKLHKPQAETHYILIPYPMLEGADFSTVIVNDIGIQWVNRCANDISIFAVTGFGHTCARDKLHRRLRPVKETPS